jgi:gamma-glutamyltranspeptidase/glutathione hydrolase
MALISTSGAQSPGDRPAANPRSTRSVVNARHGLIATSQPLASAAGLQVLQEGGNAIDAAITAVAVLSVVEPTMTGIGGDLFAIVWDAKTKRLYALNASGRSAYGATIEALNGRGLTDVPNDGPLAISVPGAVDGWVELLGRFGTIDLKRAVSPAVRHAREGYPVSEIIAGQWLSATEIVEGNPDARATFLPNGRAPRPGEIVANPRLAESLEAIAAGGRDVFYKGVLGQRIVADLQKLGSWLTLRDFAEHRSDWVEPISTSYRGYDVFEMPPSTQGFVALEMLNILEGFELKAMDHNSAEYIHLLVEAKRIAFADRNAHLADADAMTRGALQTLLSKDYAAARRKEIDPQHAALDFKAWGAEPAVPSAGDRAGRGLGDTVYLTAADGQGNVISLIQSLYGSFGSGIVAGNTGIVLHNRGTSFETAPGHPNRLAPHKRPMHTLVPAMVLKDGKPWLSFGVMGGDMQPQGHVQVLLNLIDFGMNVQEAADAARFRHTGVNVGLESAFSPEARYGLARRGHRLVGLVDSFGGFQGILIDPSSGVLMGGSDVRKDGMAIGF